MSPAFRFLSRACQPLPDGVYVELVDLLFGSPAPTIAIGIVLTVFCGIFASRDGDSVFYAVAIASVLVTGARVWVGLGYRRRLARSLPSVTEAKRW